MKSEKLTRGQARAVIFNYVVVIDDGSYLVTDEAEDRIEKDCWDPHDGHSLVRMPLTNADWILEEDDGIPVLVATGLSGCLFRGEVRGDVKFDDVLETARIFEM